MRGRRSIPAAAVALALLTVAATSSLGAVRPPDDPEGATVRITSSGIGPGGAVAFTGAGFVRAAGGGQAVTVKLDDQAILGAFTADADGAVSGSVTAPDATGAHWLRFLAGSGGPSGAAGGEPPARSLTADFTVAAGAQPAPPLPLPVPVPAPGPQPAPVPAPAPSPVLALRAEALTAHAGRMRVRLACGAAAACRGTVTVRTAQRVRLGHRRAVVTVAHRSYTLAAGRSAALALPLSRDGRSLLRARPHVRVRLAATVAGAKPSAKTLTLRRG